jgi:RNA 3'-terminal phosphate cyclase (ATP)
VAKSRYDGFQPLPFGGAWIVAGCWPEERSRILLFLVKYNMEQGQGRLGEKQGREEKMEPLRIDGSYGEGGGQILRTALALAALQGRPVVVDHIRASRRRPGLRPQHLRAARALAEITGGELQGDWEDSPRLAFRPGKTRTGAFRFDIGTAGACTLLIAAILPPLLLAPAPSEVVVTGGTHVPFSPPYHFFAEIFLPVLNRMGANVQSELGRWGWYPGGGGEVRLRISPSRGLTGVSLEERGELRSLELLIGLANLPGHVAQREEETLRRQLGAAGRLLASRLVIPDSPGQGNVLFLKAIYEHTAAGFSVLGRRGLPAEQVATEVGRAWFGFARARAAVDLHLADQLIPYLALAGGESTLVTERLSSHLRTNIRVVEQFLPRRFQVDEQDMRVRIRK